MIRIREQTVMTNEMPTAEPAGRVDAGKIAIAVVIACVIGAFFYFDLGKYLLV